MDCYWEILWFEYTWRIPKSTETEVWSFQPTFSPKNKIGDLRRVLYQWVPCLFWKLIWMIELFMINLLLVKILIIANGVKEVTIIYKQWLNRYWDTMRTELSMGYRNTSSRNFSCYWFQATGNVFSFSVCPSSWGYLQV